MGPLTATGSQPDRRAQWESLGGGGAAGGGRGNTLNFSANLKMVFLKNKVSVIFKKKTKQKGAGRPGLMPPTAQAGPAQPLTSLWVPGNLGH